MSVYYNKATCRRIVWYCALQCKTALHIIVQASLTVYLHFLFHSARTHCTQQALYYTAAFRMLRRIAEDRVQQVVANSRREVVLDVQSKEPRHSSNKIPRQLQKGPRRDCPKLGDIAYPK